MQPKATSALDHGLSGLCSNTGQDGKAIYSHSASCHPGVLMGTGEEDEDQGLRKTWIPACASDKQLSKLCLPLAGKVLITPFIFSWQMTYLELGFAHWVSENDKLLAQQENLLFSDDLTALFSSPIGSNSVMDKHPIQGGSKNTHSCFMV